MADDVDWNAETVSDARLNKMTYACMYWNALAKSVDLAIERGKYSSFDVSPISKGYFQFDLWKQEYEVLKNAGMIDDRFRKKEDDKEIHPIEWNQKELKLSNSDIILPTWTDMKRVIQKYGLRNSLLIALMPTATSSQPLRNGESIEAHQSNIYSRKVMNGAYPVVNRYLVKDLQALGLWSRDTVDLIQADKGSISKLPSFINRGRYPNYIDTEENKVRLNWILHKYKKM